MTAMDDRNDRLRLLIRYVAVTIVGRYWYLNSIWFKFSVPNIKDRTGTDK